MAEKVRTEGKSIVSDLHLDVLAWVCKLLAKYDLENQKELLMMVSNDKTYHEKLRKYASF